MLSDAMLSAPLLRVLYDVAGHTLPPPPDATSARPASRRSALNRFLIDWHGLPIAPVVSQDADCSRQLLHGWMALPRAAYLIACWLCRDSLIRHNAYTGLDKGARRFCHLAVARRHQTGCDLSPDLLTPESLLSCGCAYLLQLCPALPAPLASRLSLLLERCAPAAGAPSPLGDATRPLPAPDHALISFAIAYAKNYPDVLSHRAA